MWNWKPAKMVLEALWDSGQLAIAGRKSFQRQYDLVERVIPKHVLEAPAPNEDETCEPSRSSPSRRAARSPRQRSASTGG